MGNSQCDPVCVGGGTWITIHDHLRDWERLRQGGDHRPSEASIDRQSVKTAAGVKEAVGYDAGKQIKGRQRFLTVDTLGLVRRVFITAASEGERAGGKQVLQKVHDMGKSASRLMTIWVDGGFDGNPFMHWVMDMFHWVIEVVLSPQGHQGFVLLPKRWVVERTFGWFMHCRRLVRDYELLPESAEAFIYIAMIRIMVRRLA